MIRIFFEPQEDITAFELAHIYMKAPSPLKSILISPKEWETMAFRLKRHFREGEWSV
jgi:hypothetical protein